MNCLPTKVPVQIPKQDKELICKLQINFDKLEKAYYLKSNATVIAVYKSIVEHNSADKNTLQNAQAYLKKCNYMSRNLSYFNNMVDIWDDDRERKRWNYWTSGSFDDIFTNTWQFIQQLHTFGFNMLRNTVSQLSDVTRRLQSSLIEAVNDECTDIKHCLQLYEILIKYAI